MLGSLRILTPEPDFPQTLYLQAVSRKCSNTPGQVWCIESRQIEKKKKKNIHLCPKNFSCPLCQMRGNQVRHQIPGKNLLSSKRNSYWAGWAQIAVPCAQEQHLRLRQRTRQCQGLETLHCTTPQSPF